eukprot:1686624-Rhodomonas_salina.2
MRLAVLRSLFEGLMFFDSWSRHGMARRVVMTVVMTVIFTDARRCRGFIAGDSWGRILEEPPCRASLPFGAVSLANWGGRPNIL